MSDFLRLQRAQEQAAGDEIREILASPVGRALSKETKQCARLVLDLCDIGAGKKFYGSGRNGARLFTRKRSPRVIRRRYPFAPVCGAKTRKGTPCQCLPVEGRNRCKYHGGLSTGAKTEEGRARIAESNRRRAEKRREIRQNPTP